jgi:hypothetical protein
METWYIGFSLMISQLIVSLYARISSRLNSTQKLLYGTSFLIPLGVALKLTNDIYYLLSFVTLIVSSALLVTKRSKN